MPDVGFGPVCYSDPLVEKIIEEKNWYPYHLRSYRLVLVN